MKKALFVYALALLALASCSKDADIENPKKEEVPDNIDHTDSKEWLSPLTVASYNIEFDTGGDNPWSNRKELVKRVFDKYTLDIAGVQEPSKKQLEDMLALMPQYGLVGTDVRGETTVENRLTVTIFYKKDRIEIEDWGTFWLSETPTEASGGWDAAQSRICTWAKARDKNTQKEFYFFSTHLDHVGTEARTKGAQLLLDTIPKITAGYPALLTGDFNSNQNTSYYKSMVSSANIKDTYTLTKNKINAVRGTFNYYDIDQSASTNYRIDHIFVTATPEVKINRWGIYTDVFPGGKYPSDHFPVIVDVSFLK